MRSSWSRWLLLAIWLVCATAGWAGDEAVQIWQAYRCAMPLRYALDVSGEYVKRTAVQPEYRHRMGTKNEPTPRPIFWLTAPDWFAFISHDYLAEEIDITKNSRSGQITAGIWSGRRSEPHIGLEAQPSTGDIDSPTALLTDYSKS